VRATVIQTAGTRDRERMAIFKSRRKGMTLASGRESD